MDLEDDPYLEQLITNRELGEKSKWIYYHNIGLYCDLIGLNPEELINEAVEEYQLHPSKRKIRKHLIKWKDHLINGISPTTGRKYAQNTRKKMFDHVCYFYQEFEVELPKKIKMKAETEEELSIDDLPDVEDLRFTLNNTNLRTQAIILLMCSSGLAKLDVRSFKYKDFLKSIGDYYKPSQSDLFDIEFIIENLKGIDVIGTWEGNRRKKAKGKKKGSKYITFHTPETTRYILNYLKTDPPKSVDDYLFRYQGRQITEEAWDKYFNLLNKRCGFPKIGNESYMASHNFRRRFGTLLTEKEVDFRRAEIMMGHLLPKTQRSYYKTLTVKTMKKTYLEVMPALCIIDEMETRVLTDEKLAEFERREQEKDKIIETMGARLDALERREDRKDRLKKV